MFDVLVFVALLSIIVLVYYTIRRKWRKVGYSALIFVATFIALVIQTGLTTEDIATVEGVADDVEEVEEVYIDPNRVTDKEYQHYTREAQDIITDLLSSPSTADFPGTFLGAEHWEVYKHEGILYIQSWVDSQNAFGAVIRKDWEITMNLETNEITRIILGDEVYE